MEKITHDGVDYYFSNSSHANAARTMLREFDANFTAVRLADVIIDDVGRILKCRWLIDDVVQAACEKFSKGGVQ